MESITDFLGFATVTVLSVSLALLLEWLLLHGVFRTLVACRAGGTRLHPSPYDLQRANKASHAHGMPNADSEACGPSLIPTQDASE